MLECEPGDEHEYSRGFEVHVCSLLILSGPDKGDGILLAGQLKIVNDVRVQIVEDTFHVSPVLFF